MPIPPQPAPKPSAERHRQPDPPVADQRQQHRHARVLHPAQQPAPHRLQRIDRLEGGRHQHQRHGVGEHLRRGRVAPGRERGRRAAPARSRSTGAPTSAMAVASDQRRRRPPARGRSRAPRPNSIPTRTVAALPRPSGIMKAMQASWIAMACAASGTAPSQPIISAAVTKSPTSAMIVAPIGQPSRRISRKRGPVRPPEAREERVARGAPARARRRRAAAPPSPGWRSSSPAPRPACPAPGSRSARRSAGSSARR